MKAWLLGKLSLPNEVVEISLEGDVEIYGTSIAAVYNREKEIIITAEEERQAKIGKEKEEQN